MKLFLKIVLLVFIVLVLAAGGGAFYLTRGLDSGARLEVAAVNLSHLSDGTYNGEYKAGRWSNELKVTVKDHKIAKIDIVKDVTFPKPEWTKQIFDRVIEKQNTDIDMISGATVTGKAYLKSIEDALILKK